MPCKRDSAVGVIAQWWGRQIEDLKFRGSSPNRGVIIIWPDERKNENSEIGRKILKTKNDFSLVKNLPRISKIVRADLAL
jgi:hypothetical protein